MKYKDLKDFIENKIRLGHIYVYLMRSNISNSFLIWSKLQRKNDIGKEVLGAEHTLYL
jgi:hypothetical protein